MAKRNQVTSKIAQNKMVSALWALNNILEHDLHCWETIADRAEPGSYIYVFAKGRIDALRIDVDVIYEALIPLSDKAVSDEH